VPDLDHAHGVAETSPFSEMAAMTANGTELPIPNVRSSVANGDPSETSPTEFAVMHKVLLI
jgi:hypothetical protein